MRWLFACLLVVMAWTGSVQALTKDSFSQTAQWNVRESWNKDELVYTFYPNGTFRSSEWDNGRGQGTWSRSGQQLTMLWPKYGAFYRATIDEGEIHGTAYFADGRKMGTFIFRLIQQ
jgi:hypothetical protein